MKCKCSTKINLAIFIMGVFGLWNVAVGEFDEDERAVFELWVDQMDFGDNPEVANHLRKIIRLGGINPNGVTFASFGPGGILALPREINYLSHVCRLNAYACKAMIDEGSNIHARHSDLSALDIAASAGHANSVRVLLDTGADVDAKDSDGWTALHHAAVALYSDYVRSNWKRNPIETARLLLGAGANVSAKSVLGRTPLHIAASEGDINLVRFLIDAGADPNAKDYEAIPVIHMPIMREDLSEGEKIPIVQLLISEGADINVQDWNPMRNAAFFGLPSIAKLLIAEGADVNVASRISGMAALHVAAEKGHVHIAKMLIDAGADKRRKDNSNRTAREIASTHDHTGIVELLKIAN